MSNDISVDDFLRGNYLEKGDFPEPRSMTIIKGDVREVGQEQERKLCIWFAGEDRPMTLNKTNINTMKDAYGSKTSGWIGKQVIVYNDPNVSYAGKRTGGLRIRVDAPTQEAMTDFDDLTV